MINGDKLVVIGGGLEKLVAKLEVKKSILAETGVRRQNWRKVRKSQKKSEKVKKSQKKVKKSQKSDKKSKNYKISAKIIK
jgi:hypothetical protein